MQDKIIIKGARENNLKNITLEIPKNKLIVMTGLSGSGKTTLAFDTIYAEGQRRYVESLSSYARQFLGGLDKPDVDVIEGLSPAIAIDQKSTHNNPRSTVGTVTEIYDYLRLLYARVGTPYCPTHHIPITAQTVHQMVEKIHEHPIDSKLIILSPVARQKKGTYKTLFEKLLKSGFIRVRIDKEMKLIEDLELLDKNIKHDVDIVVDRLTVSNDNSRLVDSLNVALEWSNGLAIACFEDEEILFSSNYACPHCGFSISKLEPKLFSFNSPMGACPTCLGLGYRKEADPSLLVPDESLSINQGAIVFFKNMIDTSLIEYQELKVLCDHFGIDMDAPYSSLSENEKRTLLYGSEVPFSYTITTRSGSILKRNGAIEGVKTRIERLYMDTSSDLMRSWYSSFMVDTICPTCHGQRLNQEALSVYVGGKNLYELTSMPVEEILDFIKNLQLSPSQQEIARLILKELIARLGFLVNVGLEYLTLSREASTLSGGEAQRIRLATQIGSNLTGVLYVLDEPSIGLHQKDNSKLINTLKTMRDLGNTLIVVEHDEDTMLSSDYLVDIGPGSGIHGGNIVASGTPQEVMNNTNSITGNYLSKRMYIPIPKQRRQGNGKDLEYIGCKGNNLKNINVKIPLNTFTVVTGVSGSGKSTLVNETIANSLLKLYGQAKIKVQPYKNIKGLDNIDKVINVTQEPIGRTPRSNPATYTGVFDLIRTLFALTKDARMKGYDKSMFSFNVKGGRCERCQGDGVIKVPMHFLPDVYVPCEECNGKRYSDDVLSITYKDKNIFEVLDMTIEEAYNFFENVPKIKHKLKTLVDVGLGYIKLGQNATTLSGGEAQRLKLASELQRKATGKTLFILDEPTTGLHNHDVKRLLNVLHRIVDNGDSVVVIEHNLEVIKNADYIIDLGPDGGNKGGNIVAKGTPEEVSKVKESYTGQYLKKALKEGIYE